MTKSWTESAPSQLVSRVLRGLHREGQVVAVQEIQDAVYGFPDACIQAKDTLWITLEVLLEGELTVRMEVLGEYLCDTCALISEHREDVAAMHLHLMSHPYSPVAAGSQSRQ